jgi:hypothetical protein
MSNKNLFQEAIADAKAVREAALANAKAALEEALTPKLQSMLAAKLNEMNYMEEDAYEEGVEEGFSSVVHDDEEDNPDFKYEEGLEEEFDLSEILAELEEDSLNEAKEEDEEDEEEGETEPGKEDEEIEMPTNVEELTALIKDLISQEMPEGTPENAPEEGGEDMGEELPIEEEINLEELLAELEALGEADELEEAKKAKAKKMAMAPKKEKEEKKEDEKDMKEALNVINTLRAELNEVNLLNAKLLYVNKIFKAKNLSESQKLQVIASFDKATTAKEAKVVFESLNATLTAAAPKQAIKESLGFASKAAGVAPRKAIVESNDVITRMQKLANIIK